MPEPAAHALMEIIAPSSRNGRRIVCECCRLAKDAEAFDDDCCGICSECLEADELLVDFDRAPGL